MSDDIEIRAKYPFLTERERSAYRVYSGLKQSPVAPSTVASFFSLFLAGKSCQEIVEANRGFSLGQIVQIRIDYKWDELRTEYLTQLMKSVSTKMLQSKLETVSFVTDALSATHKLWGQKIIKYLQTGNESELQNIPIGTLGTYKLFVNLLNEINLEVEGNPKPLPPTAVHVNVNQGGEVQIVAPTSSPDRKSLLESLGKKLQSGNT